MIEPSPHSKRKLDIFSSPINIIILLKETFQVIVARPSPFFWFTFLFFLTAAIIRFLVPWLEIFTSQRGYVFFLISQVSDFFEWIIETILLAFVVWLTEKIVTDKPHSLEEFYVVVFPRLVPMILTEVWKSIRIVLYYLLLIIPGIYKENIYAFTAQLAVLRGKYANRALDESEQLVKDRWGNVFIVRLIPQILSIGLILGLLFIRNMVLPGSEVINQLINYIYSWLVVFTTIFTTIYFLKLEHQRDVQIEEFIQQNKPADYSDRNTAEPIYIVN
jgi:hypothetical protein